MYVGFSAGAIIIEPLFGGRLVFLGWGHMIGMIWLMDYWVMVKILIKNMERFF